MEFKQQTNGQLANNEIPKASEINSAISVCTDKWFRVYMIANQCLYEERLFDIGTDFLVQSYVHFNVLYPQEYDTDAAGYGGGREESPSTASTDSGYGYYSHGGSYSESESSQPAHHNPSQIVHINHKCYCGEKLVKYDEDPSWCYGRCLSCYKLTEGLHYGCHREGCIFDILSDLRYAVCANCYFKTSVERKEETEEKEIEVRDTYSAEQLFIEKKVRITIQQISYEVYTVSNILSMTFICTESCSGQ